MAPVEAPEWRFLNESPPTSPLTPPSYNSSPPTTPESSPTIVPSPLLPDIVPTAAESYRNFIFSARNDHLTPHYVQSDRTCPSAQINLSRYLESLPMRQPIMDSASQSTEFNRTGRPSVKHLECYWWKTKGSCKFSDDDCLYAHHETGQLADPPRQLIPGEPARAGRSLENAIQEYQVSGRYSFNQAIITDPFVNGDQSQSPLHPLPRVPPRAPSMLPDRNNYFDQQRRNEAGPSNSGMTRRFEPEQKTLAPIGTRPAGNTGGFSRSQANIPSPVAAPDIWSFNPRQARNKTPPTSQSGFASISVPNSRAQLTPQAHAHSSPIRAPNTLTSHESDESMALAPSYFESPGSERQLVHSSSNDKEISKLKTVNSRILLENNELHEMNNNLIMENHYWSLQNNELKSEVDQLQRAVGIHVQEKATIFQQFNHGKVNNRKLEDELERYRIENGNIKYRNVQLQDALTRAHQAMPDPQMSGHGNDFTAPLASQQTAEYTRRLQDMGQLVNQLQTSFAHAQDENDQLKEVLRSLGRHV